MENILKLLNLQFFIPVIRTKTYEEAKRFCFLLSQTGLVKNFEITLTTPGALKLVQELTDLGFQVGVGSVTTADQAKESLQAGAKFIISAGLSEKIAKFSQQEEFLYIPGVLTPTEILKALDYGFKTLKLFPYSSSGGVKHLKNISAPFPQVSWMPTGGIQLEEAISLKDHSHVLAVGMGSQLYPMDKISRLSEEIIIEELKEVFKQGQL